MKSNSLTMQNPWPTGTIRKDLENDRTGQVLGDWASGSRKTPLTDKQINAGCKTKLEINIRQKKFKVKEIECGKIKFSVSFYIVCPKAVPDIHLWQKMFSLFSVFLNINKLSHPKLCLKWMLKNLTFLMQTSQSSIYLLWTTSDPRQTTIDHVQFLAAASGTGQCRLSLYEAGFFVSDSLWLYTDFYSLVCNYSTCNDAKLFCNDYNRYHWRVSVKLWLKINSIHFEILERKRLITWHYLNCFDSMDNNMFVKNTQSRGMLVLDPADYLKLTIQFKNLFDLVWYDISLPES